MTGESAILLDLIQRLYAAAAGDGAWPVFLQALASALDAVMPGIFLVGADSYQPIFTVQEGIEARWREAFDAHYVRLDVRRPLISQLPQNAVFRGQDVLPDRELVQTEFYNDFLRPQRLFHIGGGVFLKDEHHVGVLRVLRPPAARPFGARERRLLAPLLPHVRRAVTLQQRFREVCERGTVNEQILQRWNTGVVLLDQTKRVVWMNAKAEGLLRARSALIVDRRGVLVASHAGDERALAALVGAAAADGTQLDGADGALAIRRGRGHPPLHALVTGAYGPLRALAGGGALAMLVLRDPAESPDVPVAVVQHHLGLTRAEARLALALAQGLRVVEAAELLGVTVDTARTHLKRALSKTGVHRQAELVRLVLNGPMALWR